MARADKNCGSVKEIDARKLKREPSIHRSYDYRAFPKEIKNRNIASRIASAPIN